MKRYFSIISLSMVMLMMAVGIAVAHDLFLKPVRYRIPENATVLVRVLNGTFSSSENSISRDRLIDLSIVSPTGRSRLDTAEWRAAGDTSTFRLRTGGAGTYVLGVSTRARTFELTGKQFNDYLASDGIPDVLAARRRDGELEKAVRERYGKHVKAIMQVGSSRSDDYLSALGYPAEIVPLVNPYSLRPGGTLRVRAIVDGAAAPNQLVVYGGRTTSGARIAQRNVRTGGDGTANIPLRMPGTWYVKFIHMTRQAAGGEADYESKWATLTFEIS
jgi:hypothetical protein